MILATEIYQYQLEHFIPVGLTSLNQTDTGNYQEQL